MNTFSNEKRQYFYEEIKARFYLRKPKSKRPTRIFLVVYIGGKQHRYPTQVRVYPSQWNSKKQLAVVSNVQSEQDNRNNKIVNEHLIKVRHYFSEYIEYICNNDVADIAKTLKQFIYRGMAKTNKRKNIYDVIPNALEHYHKYVKPSIKDSTKRQNESLLSEFRRFLDTLPSKDRTIQIFSQRGLNRYKQYLIDKMELSKTDDKMRNFGVGQLNRCGAIIALLINRVLVEKEDGINPVVWNKVDDPRREDQIGHIPLLDNEVVAIENCSGLTDVEEEYRNLFLLQLECGQRVSDMAKILTEKYNVEQGKKYKYIVLSTIKENIKAYVPLTPRMTMLMERVKAHKLVDPIEFEKKTKGKGNGTYNEAIRRIAKKAELCREIVKINASQTEVRKPLYETITSHDARCTFITNMIKKGVSPERLCKMTGHASDEMIKRVYAQLSDADEINRIESDLYNDMDDDDSDTPTDTPSKKPNEIESFVPKEVTTTMPINLDSEPSSIFESDEIIAYDNYIRGLNDIVDRTINEMNAFKLFEEDDNENILQIVQNAFIARIDELKQGFETLKLEPQTIESFLKKVILDCWSKAEVANDPEFMESASENYDNPRQFADVFQLSVMRTVIDYSRENRIGEDLIGSLEEEFHAICKEKPDAFFIFRVMLHIKVIWPINIFFMVVVKMEQFIQENRPIADNTMIQEDNRALKKVDWRVVFRELQKTPAMALETLIQNTKCGGDVKSVLSNSVKEGDFESFNKTIITHEHEVRILINHSYSNQYFRKYAQTADYLFKESTKGVENPIEMINRYNEVMLLQYPFVDNDLDESTPDFLKKDIQEIDIKELVLWKLDVLLKAFDDESKNYLYPSEKKIFDKVRSLVDFNKYPELKEAYEDYKARQNTPTKTEISDDNSKQNEKNQKPEVTFDDLVIFKSEIDLNKQEPNEFLSSPNSSIIQRGDDVFKEFINFLVYSSCIDDNDAIKQLLVYRLTGRCRPKGELEKILWNPDKLNELAYVIRYATARGAIGKYEKVRDFFEGPTFPENISMIRTTADNAPLDFRLKLNSLYPDVFTIKGAR